MPGHHGVNRWELRTCARRGHMTYAPDDETLAHRLSGLTGLGEVWRCLRRGEFTLGAPHGRGPADKLLSVADSFTPNIWLAGRAQRYPQLVPFSAGPVECLGRNLVLLSPVRCSRICSPPHTSNCSRRPARIRRNHCPPRLNQLTLDFRMTPFRWPRRARSPSAVRCRRSGVRSAQSYTDSTSFVHRAVSRPVPTRRWPTSPGRRTDAIRSARRSRRPPWRPGTGRRPR